VIDVARALRIVAEPGDAGETYNVANHQVTTINDKLERIARSLGTSIEVIPANGRELSTAGLKPSDFPLYQDYPRILSTQKVEALGWTATPPIKSIETVVDHYVKFGRDGADVGPDREAETKVVTHIEAYGSGVPAACRGWLKPESRLKPQN
jgi:dTDP-D-glucose 4,6-dehydratase